MKEKTAANMSFEEAIGKLERIVDKLQSGSMPLQDSIDEFEEGIKLVKICRKELDGAQARVNMLLGDADGNTKEVPFKADGEE